MKGPHSARVAMLELKMSNHESTLSFFHSAFVRPHIGELRYAFIWCVQPRPLLTMAGRKAIKPDDEPHVLAALATFSLRDQAAFVLGMNTGFRATELLSLDVGDVCRDGCVRANVTVARRRLKGGRGRRRKAITSRTVPLNDAAIAALQRYLFSRFGSGPVMPKEPLFPSRFHGMRLTRWRLNRLVKEVLIAAGIGSPEEHGTHTLRKTFARKIYTATGNDLNLTRAVLGHASVSTTQRYLEIDHEEVSRAILSVGRASIPTRASAGGR